MVAKKQVCSYRVEFKKGLLKASLRLHTLQESMHFSEVNERIHKSLRIFAKAFAPSFRKHLDKQSRPAAFETSVAFELVGSEFPNKTWLLIFDKHEYLSGCLQNGSDNFSDLLILS